METHGAPMQMSDSTIVQLAMTRDITERAHIEADLRKSEEQLRTLAVDLENQVRIRTRELEQRNSEVLQQSEQLQQLTNRLLQAQDDERRHVARELHDTAGQTLAVLGISVTALLEKAKQLAPQLANDVDEVQQIVLQLQQDIRTTSYLLHPPLLDENGLPAALQWYVKGIRERSGLDITLNISEEFGRLPQELELAIFRIVQECLVNIHRHSGSKVAEIVIAHEAQTVTLSVQDHGYGIPPEQLADIQTRGSGVGIRGMRERVRLFHGTTKIESNGCGTKVSATIPIPHGADATTDAGHEIKSHQEVG
jgi:signal transduction histidine kinase